MTETYINQGAIAPMEEIASKLATKERLAIIRGSQSFPKIIFEKLNLKERFSTIKEISGFSSNPKFEEIRKGIQAVKEFNPELIIGVGGGSILDIAKIISRLWKYELTTLELSTLLKTSRFDVSKGIQTPLILMPTTAGSGAEVTSFSVVYFGQEKFSFAHSSLLPDYVIADPSLVKNAPNKVLASSVMDAISQSIESIWSRGSTEKSKKLARKALLMLWKSASTAINTRNSQSLSDIVLGSHLAGKAINISKTTANHALSYKITTSHGIPHGHCVGMLLPQFFKLHEKLKQRRQAGFLENISDTQNSIAQLLGYSEFSHFQEAYSCLLHQLGLQDFDDLNKKHKFDSTEIVNGVNVERLSNHPVKLNAIDLEQIFLTSKN